MMTPFKLDLPTFRKMYPGLTEDVISDVELLTLWGVVDALLGDGEGNFPYPESSIQTILYAALCHLEGSVSTSFENLKIQSETGEWWNQTKCGALFWVLTKRYRVACRFYGGRKFHPWG